MNLKAVINFTDPLSVELKHSTSQLVFKKLEDPSFDEKCLGWCSDKNLEVLFQIKSGTILISDEGNNFCNEHNLNSFNRLIVKHPRKSFFATVKHFLNEVKTFGNISPSAVIDPSVKINKDTVNIGHNVVIERDVTIGDYVEIQSNTVINQGSVIHNHVKVGSNNTIGGVGFGYEPDENGNYDIIPHIGNVILSEGVEIGNNTCIDRAVLGSTYLGKNVKVDNLVHIAHGVQIGDNSLIIANAMLAGSVNVGTNVWVAPSSSVRQKLTIDDNSTIGMGSVVVKDVEKSTVVAGVPAKELKK